MFKHDDDDTDDVNGAHSPEPEVDPSDGDETSFEADEEMGDLAGAQAKIKKLRDQLKEAQAKRDEYLDGWQRCKAEGVNVRKEAFAAADRAAARAREGLIEDIIPVLDSFDMAATGEAWAQVDESWRSGMEQVRNQLLDVLARNGVVRYGKVGEVFDHALHEAVQELDDAAGQSGEIVRVLRFGYKSQDPSIGSEQSKILRPAQVIVKK